MFKLNYTGGERVSAGDYWNFVSGDRVHLDGEAVLPGIVETSYVKLPPVVLFFGAPILGLIYALFLPFIGIALLLTVLARKLFGETVEGLWKVATFGWRPSEAYLLGRKHDKATPKKAEETHPDKGEDK